MGCIEPKRLVVRHHSFMGAVKQPVRVVHFTDTHFREPLHQKELANLILTINEQQADILVFTGDLMDHYDKSLNLRNQLPPYLRQIRAKMGKYAVYGNHDIGGGALRVYRMILEQGGFQLLCNETISFSSLDLTLFGIDDPRAGYEDYELTQQSMTSYQILLSHEPDLIDTLDISNIDLVLSGHTHGGQIFLPLLSRRFLPTGGKQYRKGLYKIKNTMLSVSSGIGCTWLPLRFRNIPEIIVYDIEPMQ